MELIQREQAFQRMRASIRRDPTKPIKRVYNAAVEELIDDDHEEEYIPTFNSLRSRLGRVRASLLPPIPQIIDDVVVEDEWAETWRGDQFLSLLYNEIGISIFATEENIETLERCNTIYLDGTFKTCPVPYLQLMTIHGKYLGGVLTLVWALLTGKTALHYRTLLAHIKECIEEVTGNDWNPQLAITDFEQSLKRALRLELPNTVLNGCYFHFCQSLWRHVQELGLVRPYHQDRRLKKIIRKLMALGHLPPALVRNNFQLLLNAGRTARALRRYPALEEFFEYIRNTYIDGPTFPIHY